MPQEQVPELLYYRSEPLADSNMCQEKTQQCPKA